MAKPHYTQDNIYLSLTTPLGKDKLLLQGFHGEESLSGLFHFSLEMISQEKNLDFSAIVGKKAAITMVLRNGQKRYLSGIVGRFYQAGTDPRFTRYYAELYPWLWLLTKTADCRIFQAKTVPEIVEAIFTEMGQTDYRLSLNKSYAKREYTVQYQETAFNFVSRLLEEEGIFYFFEHAASKHTLVLADDASAHQTCPELSGPVQYRSSLSQQPKEDAITHCTFEQQVTTDKVAVDDFNFETPTTDLKSGDSGQGKLRVFEYPGIFTTKADGTKRAKVLMESYELPKKLLRGDGLTPTFTSGYKFKLAGFDRAEANTNYVLEHVTHQASVTDYSNAFQAFPSDVPYRPPQKTPHPTIPGTQTALVVGKSGEEIWTDKYGRIKVQFHWDQKGQNDENSSCWIRVAQGWAGQGWGGLFIPRIGQEVVVSFINGDPDRPLVTGSVYNAQQTVPYTLPTDATKSTIKSNSSKGGSGFNEIRFEDKKDSEELYIHAQKDANVDVLHNLTSTIKQDRTATIQEGNELLTVTKGNRTIAVSKGNESHSVKGTRALTVTGNETHTNKGNFNQTVSGNYVLKVDGDLTIDVSGTVTIKSGTSMTSKAGTSMTNKAGTSMTNKAGTSMTNKATLSMTNEADLSMTVSGSASTTVKSDGITSVKGTLLNLN